MHQSAPITFATLALGLWPRQGVARLWAKRENWKSHHMLSRVQRVWGNEPSHSQVNSHVGSWSPKWTLESSEHNCRGQNPLPWKILYIIEKLLKRRCLKWAMWAHFNIQNTSYGQKKGWESNWQFDSWSLKVRNRPDSLVCRWRAVHHWKAFDEGYNFALDLIVIGGLHTKLCTPKVARVPFGSLETKSHLDVAPMERRKVYSKGEGGGFPQVWAMVSLVNPSCAWFVLAPKVLQLCTNHLVLVSRRFVWVIEACQFFLVPSRSSNTPFYPSKVLRDKECASTPYSSIVFSLDSHLSPSRSWERIKGGQLSNVNID
jgi:hypothetical protein